MPSSKNLKYLPKLNEDAKTIKDQVHWRIWDKARHGDNKCIEILAQLGCLDGKD